MIHVLCSSCNTHLADTDINRLDWPLTGEMFSIVFPGWYLRPGMLNLDVFCPACGAFPFHYNPHLPGGNAIGKMLTVKGPDGKPVVKTIKQIILDSKEPAPLRDDINKPAQPKKYPSHQPIQAKSEFPCPTCGARKRFHKKDCKLLQGVKQLDKLVELVGENHPPLPEPGVPLDKYARLSALKDRQRAESPLIASIAGRVGGMSADKGTGPATEAEVRELLADRESRRMEIDKDVDLRPGEGYQRQNV